MSKEYEFKDVVQSLLFSCKDKQEIIDRGKYLKSLIDEVVKKEIGFKTE